MIRVLLTNDDGIDAPGLCALEAAFTGHSEVELWVVAPDGERSTCSHGMTLSRPVSVRPCGERRFAVGGLPADCVYLALFGLMPLPADVVVSGVNSMPNLGCDVIYSGTVAGAREAAVRGVHGIAVSMVPGDDFAPAAANAARIALAWAKVPASPAVVLNLNYPGKVFEGPRFAPLGQRLYPKVTRRDEPRDGAPHYWLGGPKVEDALVDGTDGWLISRGIASATFLVLDHTDKEATARGLDLLAPLSTLA